MDYGQPVRFGIFVTPVATEDPLRLAVLADELGFDLLGVQDHPYQRRFFDTLTLLAAMAMRTERIALFPDVANMQLRAPALLAKSAATIDLLSGGRFELGLGAGGFSPAVQAYGGPACTPATSESTRPRRPRDATRDRSGGCSTPATSTPIRWSRWSSTTAWTRFSSPKTRTRCGDSRPRPLRGFENKLNHSDLLALLRDGVLLPHGEVAAKPSEGRAGGAWADLG